MRDEGFVPEQSLHAHQFKSLIKIDKTFYFDMGRSIPFINSFMTAVITHCVSLRLTTKLQPQAGFCGAVLFFLFLFIPLHKNLSKNIFKIFRMMCDLLYQFGNSKLLSFGYLSCIKNDRIIRYNLKDMMKGSGFALS